jgi:hypothetical protein
MDRENMVYINICTYSEKMDGTGDHHAELDNPSSKDQILAHLWNPDLK